MNLDNPLISIVVPSFNHDKYIHKCIDSIINQDYSNYELIVIDDGSSDNSAEILINLQEKFGFYLELNKNQGLSKTLNRGFRDLAKGKYYTFCASDDFWLPGKLRKQVQFLETNKEFGMVFGKSIFVDENDIELEEKTKSENQKLKGGKIFKELLLCDFHPPVNYMLRADIVKEVGYYREDIWAEDFDMNLRIAAKYPIGYINDYINCYRVFSNTPSKSLNFKTIYSHKESIEQFKESIYYKKAIKKWHFKCFTWYAPFKAGKILAIKGMLHSLDKLFTRQFLISLLMLIFKWHKE